MNYLLHDFPYFSRPIPIEYLDAEVRCIYAIRDEWCDVVYVGETKCLKKRLTDHIGTSTGTVVALKIDSWLIAHKRAFHFAVLELHNFEDSDLSTKLDRIDRERYWIRRLSKEGFRLQNVVGMKVEV